MTDDLIHLAQQQTLDIETKKLFNTQADPDDNSDRIRKLEEKVANLSLLSESLWELLTKKTKLTNDELAAVIPEVMQQRRQREETKLTCIKCKMQNSINHKKCVYCGGEPMGVNFGHGPLTE
jgi:hypothetical protein